MNAAFEMSKWLVVVTIFLVQIQFPLINSFSTVYHHSDTGRKLFGGYRIVPKPCTVKSDSKETKPKTGICMFNYECNQRGGEMIGSCIDGFLFGVCCSLPQSAINVELENDDSQQLGVYTNTLSSSLNNRPPIYSSINNSNNNNNNRVTSVTQQTDTPTAKFSRRPEFTSESTNAGYLSEILTASEDPDDLIGSLMTGNSPVYDKTPPKKKPILQQYFSNQTNGGFIDNQGFLPSSHTYPAADTILLNPDGTIVEDDKDPESLFTPPKIHQQLQAEPVTLSSLQSTQNKYNYGYVTGGNGQVITVNKHTPMIVDSTTKHGMDATTNAIFKFPSRPSTNKFAATLSHSTNLFPYMTHRPTFTTVQNKIPVNMDGFTKPQDLTTVSVTYKKTESIPTPSSTMKPKPSYSTSNENLILVQTVYNRNNTRRPTTKIPVESTQSTSKASYKPSYLTSRYPVKPTTSSDVDFDEKYPGYNYDSYMGISKPPILISHPVGLDDGGQAISHIIGILNTTDPKPENIETVTRPMSGDGGLSTWVSIVGDEKPSKYKYPTPGSSKPGVTTTAYVHGPSFSVASNDNKPAPTVVVISPDTSGNGYFTKPTKRPVSDSSIYFLSNKLTSKKPTKKPSSESPLSNQPHKPSQYYQNNVLHTGQENLVNFPPVRNPDLNVSSLNQVEKPTVVQSYLPGQNEMVHLPSGITLEVVPDNVDLNTINPDEDYSDFTTPNLHEDKVQNQVHSFVEKIVSSLAGNFQDLESILFTNENKTSITNENGIQLNNIQVGDSGEKITTVTNDAIITTKKPFRRPTTIRPTDSYDTTILETFTPTKKTKPTTKKPPTTYITTSSDLLRPSTSPTSTGPVKKPTVITTIPTKKPTTYTNTPTKRPVPSIITASKRPTTSVSTKKPSSTVTTSTVTTTRKPGSTKRPKPSSSTKRSTTSTTTSTIVQHHEEVTDSVAEDAEVTTTEVPQTSAEQSTLDFRKECGVRPLVKKGGRIVGGKGSQFGYYPWQVLVRESTWLGLFTKNKCGGVLITNRYVITAAHCQPGFLASLVAVFGEFDISGELEAKRSVAKNVRRVIVHRQYDPATFENDLALLELDSPVTYEEHIVPICMPKEGEDYVGRMATVTGWGRLKYGGGVPSVLQEVRVPLIENSVCQEMFQTAGHQKRIISSFLCAGYANGQKDSCEGDSGGPLMVEREDGRWVLLGTVSHGIKCAAPYLPGVYMRTTYYKPWLKSITGVNT